MLPSLFGQSSFYPPVQTALMSSHEKNGANVRSNTSSGISGPILQAAFHPLAAEEDPHVLIVVLDKDDERHLLRLVHLLSIPSRRALPGGM